MSERQHYILSSGSPTKRAVPYANTLYHLREEEGQESEKNPCGRPKEDEKRALHQHILTISPPSLTSPDFLWHLFLSHICNAGCVNTLLTSQLKHTTTISSVQTCLRDCIDNDSWCCPCGDSSHQLSVESLQKPLKWC